MKKRLFSLFLAMVMCMMSFSVAFASGGSKPGKDTFNNGTAGEVLPSGVGTMAANVFAAIKSACFIVAVFLVVFFGVKYLTAGAGEKAKTKEMLVPFLIGVAILMLAPTLVEWIWGFVGTAS